MPSQTSFDPTFLFALPSPVPQLSAPGPSRRRWLQWAGAAALAPSMAGCGGTHHPGPALTATLSWGRQQIRQAMQASEARAASVALMQGDRLVWQEAFGVLDDTSRALATPDTRFNVGSVSKVVAALAVM